MLMLAGCTTPAQPSGTADQGSTTQPVTCRMVQVQETGLVEECGPVSYTETVCGKRTLESDVTLLPKVDICSIDGPCSGLSIDECSSGCTKAMTRCVMVIKNLEDSKSGEWKVGANFTIPNAAFLKDPQALTIRPGETGTFDFYQFYSPGIPITTAECNVFVMEEPQIEDCHDETRTKDECAEVEKPVTVMREVCE